MSALFYYLEGPDGAGKSTLANEMADIVFHHGPYPDLDPVALYKRYESTIRAAAAISATGKETVAIDRGHVSEFVYGHVLRGESRLSPEELDVLNDLVDELGGLRVYVTADPAVIEARIGTRGEAFLDHSDRRRTRAYFWQVCRYWPAVVNTTERRTPSA